MGSSVRNVIVSPASMRSTVRVGSGGALVMRGTLRLGCGGNSMSTSYYSVLVVVQRVGASYGYLEGGVRVVGKLLCWSKLRD